MQVWRFRIGYRINPGNVSSHSVCSGTYNTNPNWQTDRRVYTQVRDYGSRHISNIIRIFKSHHQQNRVHSGFGYTSLRTG